MCIRDSPRNTLGDADAVGPGPTCIIQRGRRLGPARDPARSLTRSEDLPAAPVHVGNFKIRVRPEASLVLISQSERENVVLTPRMFDSFEEFATFTREILPALPQRFDLASQAGEPTDHAVYRARLRDDLEKMDGLD